MTRMSTRGEIIWWSLLATPTIDEKCLLIPPKKNANTVPSPPFLRSVKRTLVSVENATRSIKCRIDTSIFYYSYIEPTYRLHRIALSITQLVFSQSPQYIYLRKAYEKGKLLYAGCVQLWINPWAGEVPEISASLVQNRRRTAVEKRRKVSLKSRGTTLRHHVRSKFN